MVWIWCSVARRAGHEAPCATGRETAGRLRGVVVPGLSKKKVGPARILGGRFFFVCVFFFLIVGVNLEDNWMVVSSCCFSMFTPIWAPVFSNG